MRIKYSKILLEPLIKESVSVAQVMKKLGLKCAGGSHYHLSKKIKEYKIDISHFTGKASNRGINHKGGNKKKNWQEILVLDDLTFRSSKLRRALVESGRLYKCEICGLADEWQDKKITLEVDHKNRNWSDNRPENLRFLCPNCHSQM